jgi:hypothetical protein
MELEALVPNTRVSGLDDALIVKVGCGTLTTMVVLPVMPAAVPVTVSAYVPGAAVVAAFSVSVVLAGLLVVLNESVMPLGTPETEKATLPVKPS